MDGIITLEKKKMNYLILIIVATTLIAMWINTFVLLGICLSLFVLMNKNKILNFLSNLKKELQSQGYYKEN